MAAIAKVTQLIQDGIDRIKDDTDAANKPYATISDKMFYRQDALQNLQTATGWAQGTGDATDYTSKLQEAAQLLHSFPNPYTLPTDEQ